MLALAKAIASRIWPAASAAMLGVCLTAAAGEAVPEWAKDADPDVYAQWAAIHGASRRDGAAKRGADESGTADATAEDYSAQFLMNVDADIDPSTIYLSIESISVSPQGSQITIKGMAGGRDIPLGKDHESLINGVLNVKVGNSPGEKSFVSMATDGMVTYDENGIARVTIPAAAGNFVKATVDFKPAERKLLGRQ